MRTVVLLALVAMSLVRVEARADEELLPLRSASTSQEDLLPLAAVREVSRPAVPFPEGTSGTIAPGAAGRSWPRTVPVRSGGRTGTSVPAGFGGGTNCPT